ncbi:Holliday junction resolvase RuvX [Microaceticoccus formicicus]|uniref:Holliday junction resolvase RuvX n=1 Tax=Microaceticoccus formicicus TaxID=3118105 RepID=UPI003CD01428|nr:Holliday junction resolvase RuvX [Peptoniphilaceae bacterium AMB_02]
MKRVAGLDVGDKTIGIAISDPMRIIAQGLTTLRRTKLDDDLDVVLKILLEHDVELIVVGMPKNMNDTIGPQAQRVMNFANRLRDKSGIELIYQDERLTTVSANKVLIESKVRRENRKKYVDKIAATYILQTYLDRS